jgi:hypothetical protein
VTFSLDYKIKLVAGSDIDLQKVLDDLWVSEYMDTGKFQLER